MAQIVPLPSCQTVVADPQFPGNLRLGSAAVNHQLDCLALKLLVVPFLNLLFFHGLSHFTLSFRVRQIGGGSTLSACEKSPVHHEVSVIAVFLCGLRGKTSITSMRPW